MRGKNTSFMYVSGSIDNYFEDDTPYCSLFIIPRNRSEEDYLRNIYSKITAPSPVWKESIHIEMCKSKNEIINHSHQIPRCKDGVYPCKKTPTQSLSVNFILREELIGNEVHKIRRLFLDEPWKFHHTFQTFDMEKQKVVAKQKYYELTDEYPLMSPSVCHHGSSILRYNIFVNGKFNEMKYFYMDLLRSQPMYEEENFCFFTIYTKNGTEIQLALKHSRQLSVVPTKRTFLKFEINNVYETLQKIGAKIEEIFCSDCGILVTHDPEGNPVLVSGVNYKQSSKPKNIEDFVGRQTIGSVRYEDDDIVSNCSSGCNECIQINNYNNKHIVNNQRNCSYYGYQNDSGYHNDDTSSEEGDYYAMADRSYNRRTYVPSPGPSGVINQQHFPPCRNKGFFDRYGRQYTCCIVDV